MVIMGRPLESETAPVQGRSLEEQPPPHAAGAFFASVMLRAVSAAAARCQHKVGLKPPFRPRLNPLCRQ